MFRLDSAGEMAARARGQAGHQEGQAGDLTERVGRADRPPDSPAADGAAIESQPDRGDSCVARRWQTTKVRWSS